MFQVRRCEMSDLEEVDRLLRESYYPEEPLTRANLLSPDPALGTAIVRQGHSFLAVSCSEGQPVGLALIDEPPQDFPTIYTFTEEDIKFRKMFAYMEKVSGVLEAAPDALEVRMLVVRQGWRGKGVATALLEAARQEALDCACPFLKLYCTSNLSSRLMEKLGWRHLFSLEYSTYAAGHPTEAGDMVLPPPPHHLCRLYIDRTEAQREKKG